MPALSRHPAPSLLARLGSLREGPAVRRWRGSGARAQVRRAIAAGEPVCIDVCGAMGFGAMLSSILAVHHYLDRRGVEPMVVARNPLYGGTDLLGDCFERLRPGPSIAGPFVAYRNGFSLDERPLTAGLGVERAHALFFSRYAVKEAYSARVAGLAGELAGAIGVHFRGTDKQREAERLDWRRFAARIDAELAVRPGARVFVASDERGFIASMRSLYGARMLTTAAELLSDGSAPVHFGAGDGRQKAAEALDVIQCLARCAVCIRGPSHLSAWAKVLNPELRTITLGRPYAAQEDFPETAIAATEMQA